MKTPTKLSPASKRLKSPLERRLHGHGGMVHLSPTKKKTSKRLIFSKSIVKRTMPADDPLAHVRFFFPFFSFFLQFM